MRPDKTDEKRGGFGFEIHLRALIVDLIGFLREREVRSASRFLVSDSRLEGFRPSHLPSSDHAHIIPGPGGVKVNKRQETGVKHKK
jgi:hypothetical protein